MAGPRATGLEAAVVEDVIEAVKGGVTMIVAAAVTVGGGAARAARARGVPTRG